MKGLVTRDGHYKDVLYKASADEVNLPLVKGKPIPSWFKPTEDYNEKDYPAKKPKVKNDVAVAPAAAPVDLSPIIERLDALEDAETAESIDLAPVLERLDALEVRLAALEAVAAAGAAAAPAAVDDAKEGKEDKGKK